MMRIAVFGSGGAGGYFGGRWTEAGLDVTLVARGRHLEVMQRSGLHIESPLGSTTIPVRAVAPDQEVGPVDLLVVATRTWQLRDVLPSLRKLAGPSTMVVGIQNGVEAADVLADTAGPDQVLGGTCRIISLLTEPGVIRHVGADPVITIGELRGGSSDRVLSLARTLNVQPTAHVIASQDIRSDLWRKLLFFAPLSGVGSVTRAPFGVVRQQPESRALLRSAVEEVHALSTAVGVGLPTESIDKTIAFIDSLPPNGTTSLQRDFEAGRRTELDALAGAVARIGRSHGAPTPVHDFMYAALLPLELRARGAVSW
jgi:2-dehydropantoate 2-reductase